ncbi:MAG: malto-oligosyltrehalose synthase [Planctomycetes bacterium RBG_13_62_9]|nr:MAG: malto-oligosyltrehalose synthase [Planctomycetes bacterium RBG_13_62_9]
MRIPLATYRLQFGPAFGFRDAKALVPYLAELGISDIYASPILKATRGSTHGYDVTDPDELNSELGTAEDFEALVADVQAHGMGWLQDIVPNHMAYSSDNWMLMDTFESGPRSPFYEFFDVFRDHPDPQLQIKILAPFLDSPLEEVLRRGEIKLTLDCRGLTLSYFEKRFPLYLPSYTSALWHDRRLLSGSMAGDDPRLQAFLALRDTFTRLGDMDDSPEKHRQLAEAKRSLLRLYEDDPMVNVYIDGVLESFNRPCQGPVEQSPLCVLLEQQLFKLVPWQVAYEKINYRRFFYLSDFIALRTEDPQVFERTHRKVFELTRAGVFTGLRIDHVDGLYNPRGYLVRLRNALPDCYLAVEKILELYEFLPTEWPIQGTSGYKFCNYVNSLFCRQENEEAFTRLYHEFIGEDLDYDQLLYEEKRKVLSRRMGGEIEYLTHLAMQLAPSDEPQTAEVTRAAMLALMAAFPVYRTYVDAHNFSGQDRAVLAAALDKARDKCPECQAAMDRVIKLLLSDPQEPIDDRVREARRHFLMRFQQFTGPAMAKGFEDTLLYVYNRLVSLNEVGGDPRTFGMSLDQFHRFNQLRAERWPHAMGALSTHDSKRGEDIRARLNVLSEIPDRWQQAIARWARMNEPHKQRYGDIRAPSRNDEYLLYQTLIGTMPVDVETQDFASLRQRIKDFMTKAVREAKTYSNWVEPNAQYEGACATYVDRILDRSPENNFWPDFTAFHKEISEYGMYNSLSQTTLKLTCPGFPDFYQGTELWDLNLVDPDNRRPVDFQKRRSLLSNLRSDSNPQSDLSDESAIRNPQSIANGRIKLFLIHRGLLARREHRSLFDDGEYLPASVEGSRAQHVVAFFRRWRDLYAVTVVPRFLTSLIQSGELPLGERVWQDTRIALPGDAPSDWRDAITDSPLTAHHGLLVGDVLRDFPVSILVTPTTH